MKIFKKLFKAGYLIIKVLLITCMLNYNFAQASTTAQPSTTAQASELLNKQTADRLKQNDKNSPVSFKNLSIVVNSCDKYAELWEPFFKILFLNWPDLAKQNIPVILITNTKDFVYPGVTVFKSQQETSWSDTFQRALASLKTDYLLYLQDDYFIDKLDLTKLSQLFQLVQEHKMGYLQIYGATAVERQPLNLEHKVFYKGKHEQWRTSLQAAFWQKTTFSHLLNPSEKIWDFEIQGSIRSEGSTDIFSTTIDNSAISYLNMAAEGCLVSKNLQAIKQLYNIEWQTNLPSDANFSLKRYIRKQVLPYMYWDLYLPFIHKIKQILNYLLK